MQKHLTTLGAMFITLGALNVLIFLIAVAAMASDGLLSGEPREVAEAVTSDVRAVAAMIGLLAAPPIIIGGFGLLKRKSWSWGLMLIFACLSLLSVPIGTALGAYALWVLAKPETHQILGRGANAPSTRRTIVVSAMLSLVLILASFPMCNYGETVVQGELSKLSPEELKLREFDMVYVRWVLPGIVMLFAGLMSAVAAIVAWIIGRRRMGQKAGASG